VVTRAAQDKVDLKVFVVILELQVVLELKELQETLVIQETRAVKGRRVSLVQLDLQESVDRQAYLASKEPRVILVILVSTVKLGLLVQLA